MVDWRTNRQTRKPFPVAQGPDAVERQQIEEQDNEGEIVPQEEEQFICAACGKPFVGQAYEIDGQIICPECNRIDNKLQREEQRRQQAPEENAFDESGQGGLAVDDKEEAKEEKGWWGEGF